jgi:hypothetical protein
MKDNMKKIFKILVRTINGTFTSTETILLKLHKDNTI